MQKTFGERIFWETANQLILYGGYNTHDIEKKINQNVILLSHLYYTSYYVKVICPYVENKNEVLLNCYWEVS